MDSRGKCWDSRDNSDLRLRRQLVLAADEAPKGLWRKREWVILTIGQLRVLSGLTSPSNPLRRGNLRVDGSGNLLRQDANKE
jgi:hypothetical protein